MSSEDTILEAAGRLVDAYGVTEQQIARYTALFDGPASQQAGKQLRALQIAVVNIGVLHYQQCCGPDSDCSTTSTCETCARIRDGIAAVSAILRSDLDHELHTVTAAHTHTPAIGRIVLPRNSFQPLRQAGEGTRNLDEKPAPPMVLGDDPDQQDSGPPEDPAHVQ